ncbi:hypothetical protein [Candidatus Poriferisodalis sp.]|uniref:hypothetical protein n=1 Tax=Candidatus Poriferisodalis sp. TaxID=3101277 RepID=UPI003C702B0A
MASRSSSLFEPLNHTFDENERALCERLIRADTESEVEAALREAGCWDDIGAWSVFGDNPANASMIGGQQETPAYSLLSA